MFTRYVYPLGRRYERYDYYDGLSRHCFGGPSPQEKAQAARMAWAGFHSFSGRSGTARPRGRGKGRSSRGA